MNPEFYNETTFDPGGRQDRIDTRDYHWPTEIGAALPPFDWSKTYDVEADIQHAINDPAFRIPVKNQNGSGSCGGQAWAYQGAALEALATKTFEERSAKFIYSQTYVPGGGSAGRDNAKVVASQGCGLESLTLSYDNGEAPSESFMERSMDITDAARGAARNARALSYATTGTAIDDVAKAIQVNHGVIIGITGSNNGTWSSAAPIPPKTGDNLWNHWLWCGRVGMHNGKKAVQALNSWGSAVGEIGWQWIDEDYFNAGMIWSGWTHIYNIATPPVAFHHNFTTDMKFGDTDEEVRSLQTALTVTGDFPSSILPTGYYGNATANAVFKFQMREGISPPDRNHAGPKTRGALNKLFAGQ